MNQTTQEGAYSAIPRTNYLLAPIEDSKNVLYKKREKTLLEIENKFSEFFSTISDEGIRKQLQQHKKKMLRTQERIYQNAFDELEELAEAVSC